MYLGLVNGYNGILLSSSLFIIDIVYYFSLAKFFNVTEFDDTVVYLHQAPCIIMFLLGFVYPIMWYIGCIHMIAHFLAEHIFLTYNKTYNFAKHHTIMICFFVIAILFTPAYICGLAIPPMFNNVIYHWTASKNIIIETRNFRQVYFFIFRIVYPPLTMIYIDIFADINWLIKFSMSFIAIFVAFMMKRKLKKIF